MPRLTSKLGDKLYRKWEDNRKEAILWERRRKLRKEKNKVRRKTDEAEHQPKEKRRRMDIGEKDEEKKS